MFSEGQDPSPRDGRLGAVSSAHPPFRRKGRILFWLIGVFAIVGLVPLATVAWKLIDVNREALETSQQQYQLLLASSAAREVDGQVDVLKSQLASAAKSVGALLGGPRAADSETIRGALAVVADDRILHLRYMDLHGGGVDSGPVATVSPELEALFLGGLRRAAESMSDRGRGISAVTVSDPFLLPGPRDTAVAILSVPVLAGGMFRGVLSALIDLQEVWAVVARGNLTGHTMFALDSKGRMFATSARGGDSPDGSFAQSVIVQRFLSAPHLETMPFTVQKGGKREKYLGSYDVTREGWGIFVQAQVSQVDRPVYDTMKRTGFWALLALSLAIVAAVVFAGTLSRPIDRLAAATRAFAAGDHSRRVAIRSSNEIGELAEAFNRMAAQIEDSIRRLKRAAEENNQLFLGTIRALAQAIDAKDPYTKGHSERVNKYSVIISQYIGLNREEIANIHVASLLHDVGKIGIDDAILKKPAQLTAEEMEVMKTHAARGATIMSPIRQMEKMLPGLRSHHERWRGGGYPDGLEGERIPLMARIIAVADTFDAITTNRPYQRAWTFDDAVGRLNELKGVVLDEKVVEAFNRAYHAGEFRPEERASQSLAAATA
jgi:HD-GYP domain-containing protein (c-di-GMP phosphodiesterase class II)